MDDEERERLDAMHEDVRTVRRKVEGLDVRTKKIDEKTDKIDERVFGPDGMERRVNENGRQISRLNAIGGIVVSATTTLLVKIFDLFP